jgi:beta-glucosidase
MINTIQEFARQNTRLGIPVLYGLDAVHGHNNVLGATLFPHNLGLSTSWNPKLVERVAAATAQDMKATGIPWNFAPVCDLARDPRWGRFYETFGEDPLLAGDLAAAFVRGLQSQGVAATAKHFVGYSQPLTGFDRQPAELSPRSLYLYHLPPFAAALGAGAKTVMANSGSVNGVPVHASPYLLSAVLRNHLGFQGLVVSDWEDVRRLHTVYGVAASYKEAIALAINAGVDMVMEPFHAEEFVRLLRELVQEGKVSEARINEAVRRILRLKFALGLFDDLAPIDSERAEAQVVGGHRELAKEAARESIVLLKNDGLLPFPPGLKSLAVIGPAADSVPMLMGGWTIDWQGAPSTELPPAVTILEGLRTLAPTVELRYARGLPAKAELLPEHLVRREIERAAEMARGTQAAVVAVGEEPYAEGAGDRENLELDRYQVELIQAIASANPNTVVILVAGRPLIIESFLDKIRAFLMAHLPGAEGGTALAEILFGHYNPSARLTYSWPRSMGQIPLFYNILRTGRYEPRYPFGYGLSYAVFKYEKLELPRGASLGEPLRLRVALRNTSEQPGWEVVQVYASPLFPPVLAPRESLVAYQRVYLAPGEQRWVELEVRPHALALIPGDVFEIGEPRLFPGRYKLRVGSLEAFFSWE